jgi:hypothetical protein
MTTKLDHIKDLQLLAELIAAIDFAGQEIKSNAEKAHVLIAKLAGEDAKMIYEKESKNE